MKFTLEQNHKAELEKLANSGMTPVVIAQRAKILLMKADGESATAIAEELGVSRHTAELWIRNTVPVQKKTPSRISLMLTRVAVAKRKSPVRRKPG